MKVYLLPELLKSKVEEVINDVTGRCVMSEIAIGEVDGKKITVCCYSADESERCDIVLEPKNMCLEVEP